MADTWQIQDQFWNSFGIPAYDENTVFDEDEMPAYPHITYEAQNGIWNQNLSLSASIWYRSTSWKEISQKANEILATINRGLILKVDQGYFWIKAPEGTPFAQRIGTDGDDQVKRIYISINAEALTE